MRFRFARACLVVCVVWLLSANAALASYTIDLIWADSGTSSLYITNTPNSGTLCHSGALSQAGAGHCLLVQLTAAEQFRSAIVTLGFNAANGLSVDYAPLRSIGQFGASGILGAAGTSPRVVLPTDCFPACDSAFGSFGIVSAAPIDAGTYIIGSVNLDTSHSFYGDVIAFLRSGVDAVTDKKFAVAPVQLNGATYLLSPEPGTASLLGLGILALACSARTRKS